MVETIEHIALREAEGRELGLRRERAELPSKIAEASARVQNLRGQGCREGDPELEAAKSEVGALVDRERALPDLIVDAVAERCRLEAERLHEQERALATEHEELRSAAERTR